MDEASRVALDKAFELATKQQGQPWGEEAILRVATAFRGFLEEPHLGESEAEKVVWLEAAVLALEQRMEATELGLIEAQGRTHGSSRTRQRSKPAPSTTETTPPDELSRGALLDDGVPTPVDF